MYNKNEAPWPKLLFGEKHTKRQRTWITENRGGSNSGQILQDKKPLLNNIGFNQEEQLQKIDLKIHSFVKLN